MKKIQLKKYAELIAKKGINVQKGQEVVITCQPDQPEFVYFLTEALYKAGAKKVSVEFYDRKLDKLHTRYMTQKNLGKVEDWEIEKLKHDVEILPCRIWLESEDPDALNGINMEKYQTALQNKAKTRKPYRDLMDNKHQWCIAAVPSKKWAKKVFPNLRESVAVEKLWEYILKCSHAYGDNPCEDIEIHNSNLKRRCEYLNSLSIDSLTIKSSNGTNITIGLLSNVKFLGGSETLEGKSFYYNPNIPSEEIFISPDRNRAEGTVYTSRPFAYNGKVIKGFKVIFKNGKAVTIEGSNDDETAILNKMISTDDGASYLGEVALVPYSSPIRESEVIYYSILFDENAACHLALGEGFTNLMVDYVKYSLEEIHKMGINDSVIHEDFMIGTNDTEIIANLKDGKTVMIFKDGEWAF